MRLGFMDKPSEDVTHILDTGVAVYFKKEPRYGYWTISYEKGGIPDRLKGRYMTYQDAFRAYEGYLKTRRRGKEWQDSPEQ